MIGLNLSATRQIFVLAAALFVPAASAQERPAVGPERPFQLAPRIEKTLPNGLRVIVTRQTAIPKVSITLTVLSGYSSDPAELTGLASLTAELIQEGTKTRNSRQIRREVFGMGGSLTAAASQDFTSVSVRGLAEFAPRLMRKAEPFGGAAAKGLGIIASGRMTLEEMVALRRLSTALFGGNEPWTLNVTWGEDDDLLIRKERRPNLKGAELLDIPMAPENASVSGLLAGKKAALIVREDVLGDAAGEEKEALKELLKSMDLVIVADYAFTETAALAHVYIPLAGWQEMEGLTVNFLGVAQKTARAVAPPKQRRPFHDVVSLWLKAAGQDAPEPGFLAWHALVKEAVPGLKDKMIRDFLPAGIQLEVSKP